MKRKNIFTRCVPSFILIILPIYAMLRISGFAFAAPPKDPPIPPVIDPSPPEQTAKLVFVHASVGEHWLAHWLGGRDDMPDYWDISLGGNNYNVRDYSVHNDHEIDIGHDYCDWYDVFTNEQNLNMLFHHNAVEANYDPIDPQDNSGNVIIMIKPCFTQYPIYGHPDDLPSGQHGCPWINDPEFGWQKVTVGNVKQVMLDILEVFREHPDKFFVLVTAPPKSEDVMTYGENARAIADWMVNEWLDGYEVGNVLVFDLFNLLTSNSEGEGDPCQEWTSYPENPESASDVGLESGNHHRIWEGQVQHQVQYNQNYSAYCWGHPGKGATFKMTKEFVPLLNAYYNAWVAGQNQNKFWSYLPLIMKN